MLLLSCGAAVHHARTVLAAAGRQVTVTRLPEPDLPQLVARLRLGRAIPPDPEAVRMAAAIPRRRTDRRAYDDRPVSAGELTKLRRFVEAEGAFVHTVRPDQVAMLAVTTEVAAGTELHDPAYRADLQHWTNRPGHSGDGVIPATAVRPALRRVPVRDFFPGGTAGLDAGPGRDRGAAYLVLFGPGDRAEDVLRGGEALSALLLMATADGLATEPISDPVEVAWPRTLLRELIAGTGEPYLVVRVGHHHGEPLPATPRRDPGEVITNRPGPGGAGTRFRTG
ncbi:hypothetical protein [Actinoplanes sp. N902-109]|uniref:Acg family FMN-binding oxidoreductase n=1 Tax=Actinoplanes sp. (strain N902-109) TaxID=649831 RepID=UPI0003295BAE|nr:hypothetical protein [Actinoplanes sp. N902-109]AGL16966.1 nitroreductase [Actinoplanes sp. N902-109]